MKTPNGLTILLLTFLVASAAWSFTIAGHELLGHGGHCALDPGCSWKYADAMYFDGDYGAGGVSDWQRAMGSLVTVAIAVLAAIILWLAQPRGFATYIFLWALASAGLINSGAYIAFGWLIHPGMDWAKLMVAAGGGVLAKSLVVTAGLLLILAGVLTGRRLMPRIESRGGVFPGLPVVLATYLGFSATAIAASAFVPTDDRLFMLFGGLGNGALFTFWFLFSAIPRGGPSPLLEVKNMGLIAVGSLIVIVAYVVVLGQGVNF